MNVNPFKGYIWRVTDSLTLSSVFISEKDVTFI
jgi:hypothetical protein